jgi:hypothetical protein
VHRDGAAAHGIASRTAAGLSGGQLTAVGDSVMLASAAALEAAMPGAYIDAKVGRQMQTGLTLIRGLAVAGRLRHVVVVGLGTNGSITVS